MKKFVAILFLLQSIMAFAQPKVVAHRGCRNEDESRYENTIASLKYAQSCGVDAVEFDLQLTADEKIIVFHGPILPGTNTNVQNITYKEARSFKLPGGHNLPTLEEWFIQAKKHKEVTIILEFKAQKTKERETKMVEQAMALAKSMNMGKQLEYTTFSEWMAAEIHRIDPAAKVLFLKSGIIVPDAEYARSKGYNAISYDLSGFMNNPQIIDQARALGIETTLWIANDFELYDWAYRHGVDYISTDHPAAMVKYAEAVRAMRKAK